MDRLEALTAGDTNGIREVAEAQGCFRLRQAIATADIEALALLVRNAWEQTRADTAALHRIVLPSDELDRVRRAPNLLSTLQTILGRHVPEQGDVVRCVSPGDPPTPAHQDIQYLGLEPQRWVAWIPLSDCPKQLGPIALWLGSHRLGLLEHDQSGLTPDAAEKAQWASDDLACGDAILFDAKTVHKSLGNRADRPRLSVDCRYARVR